MASAENTRLKEKLTATNRSTEIWKARYEELKKKAQPYLDALEIASKRVRAFLSGLFVRGKEVPEHKPSGHKNERDMEL